MVHFVRRSSRWINNRFSFFNHYAINITTTCFCSPNIFVYAVLIFIIFFGDSYSHFLLSSVVFFSCSSARFVCVVIDAWWWVLYLCAKLQYIFFLHSGDQKWKLGCCQKRAGVDSTDAPFFPRSVLDLSSGAVCNSYSVRINTAQQSTAQFSCFLSLFAWRWVLAATRSSAKAEANCDVR